jgi:hypothetical protein
MAFTESLLLRKGHFLSRKRGRLFKKYFFRSLNWAFKPRKKGTFFTFQKSVGGGGCTGSHCPRFRGPWCGVAGHVDAIFRASAFLRSWVPFSLRTHHTYVKRVKPVFHFARIVAKRTGEHAQIEKRFINPRTSGCIRGSK